jgi:hypothetical protein
MKTSRQTVDLSGYPDLVVIYLGMRVNTPRGVATLIRFGSKITASVEARPNGLLAHEPIIYSLFPPHIGMRQYWRDFESLERWTRQDPHRDWWQSFLQEPKGTSFWHETYLRRGAVEAVYINQRGDFGLGSFAPKCEARGSMFSSRKRAGLKGEPPVPAVREEDL